jgi:uncharacterized protein YjbI with pentapeptide repeats
MMEVFSSGLFLVSALALVLTGITGGLLFLFVRKFWNVVGGSNTTVALEFWKHVIQIAAGFLVAAGVLVSGWQIEQQAGQFLQRQKHETKLSRNKQFSESVERLSKEDFSSTEAALMSLRDLLEEDGTYKRSVKNVLKAEMLGIIAKRRSYDANLVDFRLEVARRRLRRISEEYVRLFTDSESCVAEAGADFLTFDTENFDGRSLKLRNADFLEAIFRSADFTNATLDCANLLTANLANSNFNNASLKRANLSGATLNDAQLVGSDLTFADLAGSYLIGARLFGARMTCANLRGADLTDAEVDVSTLVDAEISEATTLPALITHDQIRDYRKDQRLVELNCAR